jgi:probable HAF family extracellular repeat protein
MLEVECSPVFWPSSAIVPKPLASYTARCFDFHTVKTFRFGLGSIASAVALFLHPLQLSAGVALMDLGTLGGDFSDALAINESGEIAGWSRSSDGTLHAFRYKNGLLSNLDAQGGNQSMATAINDAGQIVGSKLVPVPNEPGGYYTVQALLFNRGLMRSLVPGTNYASASGINAWGQIAGVYSLPDGSQHAFAWRNGLVTDLGTLGGNFSAALGVNLRGEIVGASSLANYTTLHPFLYSHGLMHDLGTLGGSTSVAYAINDLGDIVGYSTTTSNSEQHAFLYSHGRMLDLGTLGGTNGYNGGNYNHATAINNRGQIVGQASATGGSYHAFIYSKGRMTDLNDLVDLTAINGPAGFLSLTEANGINEKGQIVGNGLSWDGTNVTAHAFLLNLKP